MSGPSADREATEFRLSRDPAETDMERLHAELLKNYWITDRSLEAVRRSVEHSQVASVWVGYEMNGFARAVSDFAVFGYMMDVVVWPGWRGRGLGKRMVTDILERPELAMVQSWYLRTKDAQPLYEAFGFRVVEDRLLMHMRREKPAAGHP